MSEDKRALADQHRLEKLRAAHARLLAEIKDLDDRLESLHDRAASLEASIYLIEHKGDPK